MTETREVFEMVTKQTEPDLGSWQDQERHQWKRAQRRKAGAFVVVAALVVAGGVAFALQNEDPTTGVADQPTQTPTSTTTVPFSDGSAFLGFIDLTTGETSMIKIIPAGSGIDVSPDGTQIAYVDDADGVEVVHLADIDGSNVQALERTRTPDGPAGVRWSPDGSSIVYQGDRVGDSIGNLYVVDVGSGQITQITDTEGVETQGLYYMAPTFDPTGTTILFAMLNEGADPRVDLWSVPSTGGEPTLVRRGAITGDYSPDGSQIAFVDTDEGIFEDLWVAPTTGGKGRMLATGNIVLPRWSPDGTRIAYGNEGSDGVFIVDVETGEQTLVIESDRLPEWVDDETLSLTP